MAHADARFGDDLAEPCRALVEALDAVVDVEDLAAARELTLDRLADQRVVGLRRDRPDRAAIHRRRRDDAHVAQPAHGELERPWNRRGRQREDVDVRLELLQALLVRHAEALLLVDDEKPEVLEVHVLRKHPVRSDDDVDGAVSDALDRLGLLRFRFEP